jgi:prephenate dehydrogenase
MPNPDASDPGIAAVRGAVSVASNTAEEIGEATARLLEALVVANRLEPARIVSALFTATPDLDADFPAHAARRLGWRDVPLLCAREMAVPGAMPRVVRVLLTVAGVPAGVRLKPVYLGGAAALRPDLAAPGGSETEESPSRRKAGATGARAPRRVALIGLGQIGGSIGLALGRAGGWRRVGFDVDRAALQQSRLRGAVDESAATLAAACARADIAVLATPVDTLPAVIDEVASALPGGSALLDTGSARSPLTQALERAAAKGLRVVGGHPLAGSEGHGLAAARTDLFDGTSFVLFPTAAGVPEVIAALVLDLGARPIEVAPEEHDRALARTSHLPYLIACALREMGERPAARGLSGPGFRDMTRLARSDARMALAYCLANAREVTGAWRELRAALDARIAELGVDSTR